MTREWPVALPAITVALPAWEQPKHNARPVKVEQAGASVALSASVQLNSTMEGYPFASNATILVRHALMLQVAPPAILLCQGR